MELASEALVKDFWIAVWEVQYATRHDNVPGSLRYFGKMANHNFEIWLTQPGMLKAFASTVLSKPSDPCCDCQVANMYRACMLESVGLIRIYL